MSFFQTLTNAYLPYNEKVIKNNFNASFANSAYNACHILVGKTIDTSTSFRKKASLEIMLFLIAIGFKQLAHIGMIKGEEDNNFKSQISSLAVGLTMSLKDDVYSFIEANGYTTEDFLSSKIEGYLELLEDPDSTFQSMLIVMLLERPLMPFNKIVNDGRTRYSIDMTGSKIAKDLGLILTINPLIAEASIEMRKSVGRMY